MCTPKINMIGRKFGRLTVIRQVHPSDKISREAWYECLCECGSTKIARGTGLRQGTVSSCGCLRKEVTRRKNKEYAEEKYNLKDKRFDRLTVLEVTEKRNCNSRVWKCLCDCGTVCEVTTHHLIASEVKSCGCLPTSTPENLKGRRFGRLTVTELTDERKSNGGAVWKCKCDCGKELCVSAGNLKRGATVSCGCIRRDNLTNMKFGKLTALYPGEKTGKDDGAFWVCECECGNITQVVAIKLKSGHTKSCGCSHYDTIKDLTGQKFGRLTVLSDSGERRSGSGGVIWLCRCDCGQIKKVRQDALTSGKTESCGCIISKGNERVAKLLREAGIAFIAEYSPSDMSRKRRFDFAVLNKGEVSYFIEYDGILHTECTDKGWNTRERLKYTMESDVEKNEYCLKKGIPLIRIPYTLFDSLSLKDVLLETTEYLYRKGAQP